jgi:2-keto-4-pentenoate hydratase/2-oxohepta-3-ene-1,7-dioic acid hydratase in catechol pathway
MTAMRWIHFSTLGASPCYGILDGESIREVRGTPFAEYEMGPKVHRLEDVKIEVPFVPRTFYAAGLNYVRHIREYAEQRGETVNVPARAEIGYRAVNALVAHDEPVIIPADATQIEYEGELAVVIGRKARHLSESDALSCVLGYSIGNDVSERNWQKTDRTFWRSKNTDTFKPMGPWIETDLDLDAAQTSVSVNGEVTTHYKTNDMLFGIATFISAMTRYLTLYPGDVIWMGTDGKSPALKAGDVVEVEITGIGKLRNPFVAEEI